MQSEQWEQLTDPGLMALSGRPGPCATLHAKGWVSHPRGEREWQFDWEREMTGNLATNIKR